MTTIDEHDLRRLKHMLGADKTRYPKRLWGYRNYYASASGGECEASMRRMEVAGLVRQGRQSDELVYFIATEAGCRAAGLDAKQTRRALED